MDILGGLPAPVLDHTVFHYQSHYTDRGITSGIELCALPNGEQLRLDLLERYYIEQYDDELMIIVRLTGISVQNALFEVICGRNDSHLPHNRRPHGDVESVD